jgi:hypothetical protein
VLPNGEQQHQSISRRNSRRSRLLSSGSGKSMQVNKEKAAVAKKAEPVTVPAPKMPIDQNNNSSRVTSPLPNANSNNNNNVNTRPSSRASSVADSSSSFQTRKSRREASNAAKYNTPRPKLVTATQPKGGNSWANQSSVFANKLRDSGADDAVAGGNAVAAAGDDQ